MEKLNSIINKLGLVATLQATGSPNNEMMEQILVSIRKEINLEIDKQRRIIKKKEGC